MSELRPHAHLPAMPPHGGAVAPAEPPRACDPRLEHLFRHGLRHGDINPLLYIVMRYRAQEGKA